MALRTVLTLIGAGGITSNELAAAAVTAGKIAAGGIDAASAFAAGVVDSAAIADGGIEGVDLGAQVGSLYYVVVEAASTANVPLGTAPNTLDGVTLSANWDVLCGFQTAAAENGLYNVDTLGIGANGVWTRMAERDAAAELPVGMLVYCRNGTANGQKMFRLSMFAGTLGTDALTFEEVEEGITTSGEPEAIGAGDGATLLFDLDAANTIAASIFVNGVFQDPANWSIAAGAGAGGVDQLQFASGNAPANTAAIEGIILRRL